MKIVKIISIALLFAVVFSIASSADNSSNWYIKKRGNKVPEFPNDAQMILKYGGIFVDSASFANGEKKIYLTFDAGYENGNISKILDVMKEEQVKGAFFILSNLIKKNPELVKRIADEGHLVCNHTSNHKDITKLTDSEILANLGRLESEYMELTGRQMEKFFRFPEGRYDLRTVRLLNENGYRSVFWSMAYDDWDNSRQMNPNKAKNKLISTTHEGAILLLHPTSSTNAQILRELIHEWRRMGYSFGSIKDI